MADGNPFYVGYYPGDRPLYKRPGKELEGLGNAPILNFDLARELELEGLDAPRWLLERIEGDFKSSLKAQFNPGKRVSDIDLELYGEEAQEDMPGAFGIDISLNPADWIKDPGGQAYKTVRKWGESIFDWDDFDQLERKNLWNLVLSEQIPGELGAFDSWSVKATQGRIQEHASQWRDTSSTNALALDNRGVKNAKDVDVYRRTKSNILDFQRSSRSAVSREASYDKVINSMGDALQADVKHQAVRNAASLGDYIDSGVSVGLVRVPSGISQEQFKWLVTTDVADHHMASHIKEAVSNRSLHVSFSHQDQLREQLIEDYTAKALPIPSRTELDARVLDGYSANLSKEIKAIRFHGHVNSAIEAGALQVPLGMSREDYIQRVEKKFNSFQAKLDFSDAVSSLDKALTQELKLVDKAAFGNKNALNKLKGVAEDGSPLSSGNVSARLVRVHEKAEKALAELKDTLSEEELKALTNVIDPYSNSLNSLEKLTKPGGSIAKFSQVLDSDRVLDAAKLSKSRGFIRVKHDLAVLTGRGVGDLDKLLPKAVKKHTPTIALTGGDLFEHSVQRRLLRELEKEILNDPEALFSVLTSEGDKLRFILPRLAHERGYSAAGEFLQALEGGSLTKIYLWPRLRQRFEILTPAFWSSKLLGKYDYLGLSFVGKGDKFALGYLPSFTQKILEKTLGFALLTKFNLEHGGKVYRFHGGSHFDKVAVALAGTEDRDPHTGAVIAGTRKVVQVNAVMGLGKIVALKQMTPEALELFLSLSPDQLAPGSLHYVRLARLNGGKPLPDREELQGLLGAVVQLKAWMRKNAEKLGINPDDLEDPVFFTGLVSKLYSRTKDKSLMPLTSKYVGAIQKVGYRLNSLQNWFYTQTFVGKAIQKFFRAKNALVGGAISKFSKKAADRMLALGLEKVLAAIGGVIAPGVGAVLVEAVGPVIQYALNKVINFSTKAFKEVILKQDLNMVFEGFAKSIDKTVGLGLKIIAIPLILVLVISVPFGGLWMAASPPANPNVFGGGSYLGGVPSGGGGAQSAEACGEDQITPNNCFFANGFGGSAASYNSDLDIGHGSNSYWAWVSANLNKPNCSFHIPTNKLTSAATHTNRSVDVGDTCYNPSAAGARSYYGYAYDVTTQAACGTVYLPLPAGAPADLVWQTGTAGNAGFGLMVDVTGTVNGQPRYKMALLHLGDANLRTGSSLQPGDRVAELYDWGHNSHLHIEMAEWNGSGWTVIKPETLVCR